MTTIDEAVAPVVAAFQKIEEAERNYRTALRTAIAEGPQGTQAEIGRRINRNRETLRQDALSEEERTALREKEVERQRARREAAKKGSRKA